MSATSSSHLIVKPKAIRCNPLPLQGKRIEEVLLIPTLFNVLVDLTSCDYATLLRVAKISNTTKSDRPSIQSNSSHENPSDKKRTRILFTSWQVAELERLFAEQKYVSAQERLAISVRIGLSPTQIKIWFQNRRYKSKKTSTTLYLRTA